MDFREAIQQYSGQPLTKQVILDLLRDYNRPYDKIGELVKKGELVLVKRGIYIPGPNLSTAKPEPFLLGNHLYGPSYISLDSALSYWGFIPERVFEVSSMTIKSSKTFKTKVGRFNYYYLPLPYYSFGIQQVELVKSQRILISSPEKAICDKIINTSGVLLRSVKHAREFLFEDLRIDRDKLRSLRLEKIQTWISDAPKKSSLEILIKTLKEL